MCYEYTDSRKKVEEKSLPAKKFSRLDNKVISDRDYGLAEIIWVKFNIEDIGEYGINVSCMTDAV